MSDIRQGEIRPLQTPFGLDAGIRMIVVSNDDVNESAQPIVVPIVRGRQDLPPYLIQLAEHDPHAGTVSVAQIGSVPAQYLREPIGLVSGSTMERIREAITELVGP